MDSENWTCGKCGEKMVPGKVVFLYLGHEMYHQLLKCPVCGQAYLPEEFVYGKMAEVELVLEEK